MAVAIDRMAQDFQRLQKRAVKAPMQKFFGKCLMPDGSTAVLVAKAVNETEASLKLHKGYKIVMVIDILTEAEMPKEWAKFKPSLIQRSMLI